MVSQVIRFDSDRHRQLLDVLRAALEGIQSELDGLDAATSRLRAAWDGDAQHAYTRAHADWTQAMAGLQALLAEAIAAGHDAAEIYHDAHTAVSALWD